MVAILNISLKNFLHNSANNHRTEYDISVWYNIIDYIIDLMLLIIQNFYDIVINMLYFHQCKNISDQFKDSSMQKCEKKSFE